jgi:hypothetical protein
MIRALLVSPIVFFALLPQLVQLSDLLSAAIFAFQNGFSWQKTISASTKD